MPINMSNNRNTQGMGRQSSGLNLRKNSSLNLTKSSRALNKVHAGLGWDLGVNGNIADLDASAFLLKSNGLCPDVDHVIYFNNNRPPYGIVYGGDNRTGMGDGDDETIMVELNKLPQHITKIIYTVSIFEALQKRQNFGMVQNAYIRLYEVDERTGVETELCRFNLTDNYSMFQSIIVGELYRDNGEWIFKAIGDGVQGELDTVAMMYGI